MWMPLAGRSRAGESRCHTGYTGHFSLIGTYFSDQTGRPPVEPQPPVTLPAADGPNSSVSGSPTPQLRNGHPAVRLALATYSQRRA
jgi:hypothetical protein